MGFFSTTNLLSVLYKKIPLRHLRLFSIYTCVKIDIHTFIIPNNRWLKASVFVIMKDIFIVSLSISIIVLIPYLTEAASIGNIRNKRQSSASDVALQEAVVELQRQSQLTDSQFVFDFLNSNVGISSGTGGRTVAAIVC